MNESVRHWLEQAVQKNASDIFIGAGRHMSFRIDGSIAEQSEERVSPATANKYVKELYEYAQRDISNYEKNGDDDFPITLAGVARFRVSAYNQRGTFAAVIRVVSFDLPNYQNLHIPEEVMKVANEKNGMVLVTGPAGSGKTTTLACIIDAINSTRNGHIITLEDPIEYLHKDKKSLVSQREISTDTRSYLTALRACLRQAPDIILLGEMRDHETIKTAMTAAETGHLLISTLHTLGAANTIERIVDVFPAQQQTQVRFQLPLLLRTVISQQLLPKASGGVVPAFEVMHVNSAIRNLIRESKTFQIDNVLQTSSGTGMISMDSYILNLFKKGDITKETAITHATNPEQMSRSIERM
ncbi:MAG: PilT/PilU family type 4a pilus ATPase [Defluviitaleaceae bacterium]|nr:PilT/PilU family type 4a pilus ATPase [Defluviitaleaceae bacterium]